MHSKHAFDIGEEKAYDSSCDINETSNDSGTEA